MPQNSKPKTINSVETSFHVLNALAELDGAGVTELAKHLGTTKGNIYNHLSTLRNDDYVVKDQDAQYHIGLRFLDFAHHAKSRIDIYPLVKSEVDRLAEKSGEMALYTTEEHGMGVCLYVAYGADAVKTELYVGARSELYHTAVGKAILANLPEERFDEIFDGRELLPVTENTITDMNSLQSELDEIRTRGIAFNREETIPGLVGVGAPIQTPEGDIAGAISVIGPVSRMDDEYLQNELAEYVKRSANIIEINSTSV